MRWALLIVPLTLLVGGCGSEPGSLEGSDDALKDASSSRIEWKVEGKNLSAWASMRYTGSIDYAKNRGEMVMKGASDSAPEARLVLVGRDSYIGVEIDGTIRWLKQSVDDATGAEQFFPGPGGTNPERLLQALTNSSTKVEKLGSEDIRGVTATHYRAHLDKTKLGIEGSSDEPGVVDAWIDEEGLPRRIRIPFGDEADSGYVIDLFDFGVAVDVEAPPAGEVVSEDEFGKLMDKECAGTDKAPEGMNPLCAIFGATLEGGESSPTETIPTTEGK
jgi:hypothetical protein